MRGMAMVFVLTLLGFSVAGFSGEPAVEKTVDGGYRTYYEMSDGTWRCDDNTYKYRLEISGRMPNAERDTTFVYLSNNESISFEQAWRAGGLSSDLGDYFPSEEAVLVELY